jgi:shikimate dehydrogenase
LLRRWKRAHKGSSPRALLLGSGGAARAIAVALLDSDVELRIWSRRLGNARALCETLADVLPATPAADPDDEPADLVVNATPVGSPGAEPRDLALSAAAFSPGAEAVDLAYGAPESPFRDAAREAGAQMTTGEDFFFLQARRQSELFVGGPLPQGAHEQAVARCASTRTDQSTTADDAIG